MTKIESLPLSHHLPLPLLHLSWSVRREVWEHRFLIAAPLGVAALLLIGFVVGWPFGIGAAIVADSAKRYAGIGRAYDIAIFISMVTGFAAAVFYCLDALYGERRDRSILFWKSLPVSDFEAVLSKLCVPMVVLPVIVFVTVAVVCTAMLLIGSALLALAGHAIAPLWSSFGGRFSCLAYALAVTALWYAPLYCALFLVSAWAKQAPFLWAVLPLVLIGAVAKLVFHSNGVRDFYLYRFLGWYDEALRHDVANLPIARDPGKFFVSPGLWLGLIAAALLYTAAVYLRRRSSPI